MQEQYLVRIGGSPNFYQRWGKPKAHLWKNNDTMCHLVYDGQIARKQWIVARCAHDYEICRLCEQERKRLTFECVAVDQSAELIRLLEESLRLCKQGAAQNEEPDSTASRHFWGCGE